MSPRVVPVQSSPVTSDRWPISPLGLAFERVRAKLVRAGFEQVRASIEASLRCNSRLVGFRDRGAMAVEVQSRAELLDVVR